MGRLLNGQTLRLSLFVILVLVATPAAADDDDAIAKKLTNPVASLISVPIDFDYDSNLGADDKGKQYTVIAKPVVPFSLNDDLNLITRTIIPYVNKYNNTGKADKSGLSDIQASFFLAPTKPKNGIIWGVGPILSFPTARDKSLGSEKWGAGPSAVVLKQAGPFTYGLLANHVWSYAGASDRKEVNSSLLQPFFSFTTKTATTFSLSTESTYNWRTEEWSVPANFGVGQVLKLGSQLIQLKAGVRYWADSPTAGPEGFGYKFGVVWLFPK